ncbi:MAG: DNA repair protein RadC [Liquorilactobacillus nagelii]|jgi:DNA repair protein RadC|uniref:JAB domain-containing protein n=1 Tax=Liquorilactobacillus nagelii TaxID=82688 RepID=UPI001CCF3D06|nr:DNA repair protein RadC [Liquorilactobacillus nagelii]MCI1632908.1 DNA repair protein RadC [Liquorilactobacillus nagelii]MCI1921165.1 DNA repair protein RadC [Liquorilactobacillus nagelii]MCI1977201.1 DNA repair protein RadC [Liquorilactobacillus nagelii]ULQ50040.1 DNA repair protein RadC [Liquorilactobacillus nagelii]
MKQNLSEKSVIEKFKLQQAAALSDHELLLLILKSFAGISAASQRVNEFFEQHIDLRQLKYFTPTDWQQWLGSCSAANQGNLLCEFAERLAKRPKLILGQVTGSNQLGEQLVAEFGLYQQEVLIVILLDTKNQVLARKILFKGTLDAATVHPREIFNYALHYPTARIIVAHNHPSGDPRPSPNDLHLTKRLQQCGQLLGIGLLDHLIVGAVQYLSLREQKVLK